MHQTADITVPRPEACRPRRVGLGQRHGLRHQQRRGRPAQGRVVERGPDQGPQAAHRVRGERGRRAGVSRRRTTCTQMSTTAAMSYNVDNTGHMYFGSNYYYPVLRFRNVTIPQGAVINYACLKFVARHDSPTATGYMRIYGEKAAEPADLSRPPHRSELSLYYRTR
ncbi:MAG: hypothetical protein MZV70_28915 [Desulfobacterales bacterium]|nr:hypothetical protein [Desulfobacterales bacterium]